MSRLVMNMIQYEFGVIPTIVNKEDRKEYIQSLADSQERGEETAFIDYMFRNQEGNLAERITEYKESLQDDTLNLKNDTLNDTINDTLNLSPKAKKVFEMIRQDCNVSIEEMAAKTGFSRPTVTRALSELKNAGMIKREGSKKTGHWQILGI